MKLNSKHLLISSLILSIILVEDAFINLPHPLAPLRPSKVSRVAGAQVTSPGDILPGHRIIAYYGNLYSKNMGVLGEYPEDIMLKKLSSEVKKWQDADPSTPTIPALHYIAVTAQRSPGKDRKYRARMPDSQIDKILEMAKKINAIVFLDIQVGHSNVQTEVPLLEKYLKMPNVHLGIDPEFSMKGGGIPGSAIGTFDSSDINFTTAYLANISRENNLPPKILIVHRFTQRMVTNYKKITLLPGVQIVMSMDGFGHPANKLNTYKQYISREIVQFSGIKLFYKLDPLRLDSTPAGLQILLNLDPIPVYVQYQ
ncbi:MAG: hypothetical protein NVSMB66_4550 [Candidatus Doudnabacteria bacterium]